LELKILDVGCGLRPTARITGFDAFKHARLKRSSLERAKENSKILGFPDRIDFKKADMFGFTPAGKLDIIVSNLVFHNFGKLRFKAYSRLSSWTQAGSVVMGDLFFSSKIDISELTKAFKITLPEHNTINHAVRLSS
jgi:cyclopropane fatty-acyl-phospholipid synthase-like methyltransferase